MVLEEVTADFPAESSSTSDQSPNPGRQPDGRIAYEFDRSGLPRLFSLYRRDLLPPDLDKYIGQAADHATKILGRPPQQDEIDALAYHFCYGRRTGSFGYELGCITGLLYSYRRTDKFRFPGWTPPSDFNLYRFAGLRGSKAFAAWHFIRSTAYSIVGIVVGHTFFTSYGATVSAVHRLRDARLKEYNDAEQRYITEKRKLRQVDKTPGPREGETYEMARQRQIVQEAFRKKGVAGHTDEGASPTDDMSPTGGLFKEDFENTQTTSDFLSDSQLQRQERQNNRMRERETSAHNSTGTSALSDTDSTPPTASATQPQQQKNSTSKSSWDRLRERAGLKPSSPASPETQADDGLSLLQLPDASVSSSSQSSQTASASMSQSKAQREFDERLERERSLGSGKDDGDKWA